MIREYCDICKSEIIGNMPYIKAKGVMCNSFPPQTFEEYYHICNECIKKIEKDELLPKEWHKYPDEKPAVDFGNFLCINEYEPMKGPHEGETVRIYELGIWLGKEWGGNVISGKNAKVIAWIELPYYEGMTDYE